MSRRRLETVVALALLALLPGSWVPGGEDEQARAGTPRPPNVLIIVTDDQREGLDAMPTLRRRFIGGGRLYPNFFATTPQCCPSRASILTGKYVHNHGVLNNDADQNLDPRTMLQYFLQRAGYRTAIFGKFLNHWDHWLSPPYFNKWGIFDTRPDQPENPYFDARYNLNGDKKAIDGYTTNVLGRLASRFIRGSDDNRDARPWLLYVAPTAPHSPYLPAPKYEDERFARWEGNPAVFEEDLADKPPWIVARSRTFLKGARVRQKQLRTLLSVDDMIAKLLRTMRRNGETNTIAFFVSDNGLLWAEHEVIAKNLPYQQAVNVPFAVRWPGRIDRGSVDTRLAGNIDITPTVLDAAGVAPDNAHLDGKSLLDDEWTRDRIHLEFFGPTLHDAFPPWAATRTHDYQYTEYYGEQGEVIFREYYDLASDPWELVNLYQDGDDLTPDPGQQQELEEQLLLDRGCAEQTCP